MCHPNNAGRCIGIHTIRTGRLIINTNTMSNRIRITDYLKESETLEKLIDEYGSKVVSDKTNISAHHIKKIILLKKQYITLDTSQRIFQAQKDLSTPKQETTIFRDALKYKVIKLQSQKDRLWQVIFLLCMLLIIQAGMIINLSW